MSSNIYLPHLATITGIEAQTLDTTIFRVALDDSTLAQSFDYRPGQFAELSIFGVGECPISIASTPTRGGFLEFCVRAMGQVTNALHELEVGGKIGVRGPYGNSFLLSGLEGRNLLFIGGGIGLAPLRSLINYVLDNRDHYGEVELIYGARTPQDLVFRDELKSWGEKEGVTVYLTVDRGDEKWRGPVGFVPAFLREIAPSPQEKVAFTCGPPIMIKLVMEALEEMGFPPDRIVTTLEMKMKCGVGKCGRCNLGSNYICRDGPVFTLKQLKALPGGLEI
jgi:NAD(P)H-flavin reductase